MFYSRQLEVLYEREYFHWVTNRALRRLVEEGRIHTRPGNSAPARRLSLSGIVGIAFTNASPMKCSS